VRNPRRQKKLRTGSPQAHRQTSRRVNGHPDRTQAATRRYSDLSRHHPPAFAVGGNGWGSWGISGARRRKPRPRRGGALRSPCPRGRKRPHRSAHARSTRAVARAVSGCHVVRRLGEVRRHRQRNDVIESVGTWLTAQPADVGFFQDSFTKSVPLTGGSAGVWVSGSHPYPPSFFRTQTAPVRLHTTPKMAGRYHGFVSSRNDCPPATGS